MRSEEEIFAMLGGPCLPLSTCPDLGTAPDTHNAKKKGLNVKERKALLRWRERVRAGLESA